jgi:hypothetical protein
MKYTVSTSYFLNICFLPNVIKALAKEATNEKAIINFLFEYMNDI